MPERVNAKLLPQFNGKKVIMVGKVLEVIPNGFAFDMQTADDKTVKVNLRNPVKGALTGYVEVHGIAQGQSIICDEYIEFQDDHEFDPSIHDKICRALQSIPDLWKTQ